MNRILWIGWLWMAVGMAASAQRLPRVVVMTDIAGDPDDQQSLVRLLVHADQFRIEGLLTSSRLEHGQDTRPDSIFKQLDAYAQVYSMLKQHAKGFPSPESLRAVVKDGAGNQYLLGEGHDSPASDWLIHVVDQPDPEPVWVVVWGGQRELAQALWKVKTTRSAEAKQTFVQKLRVHAIGNQDGYQRWIAQHFPELFFVSSGFVSFGYPITPKVREYAAYRGMYMTGDLSLTTNEWVRKYVVEGQGPLGSCYPADAHGKVGLKEGDTPSFLGLLSNGLNQPERPDWGGMGGRFRKLRGGLFTDAADFLDGSWNERHSVSRWRRYVQNEFAVRMQWCTRPYQEANHPPSVKLNGTEGYEVLTIRAKAGERVSLSAKGSSDPDDNALSYHWWHYWEAGNYPGRVAIEQAHQVAVVFTVPSDAPAGSLFHILLEVSDQAAIPLTRFRRALVITD